MLLPETEKFPRNMCRAASSIAAIGVYFGALRSFASKGRQRPATSLGTTGGIQRNGIVVILSLNSGKDILSNVTTSAGFEPATCTLGGGCSIQLSHEAVGRPEGT